MFNDSHRARARQLAFYSNRTRVTDGLRQVSGFQTTSPLKTTPVNSSMLCVV